MIYEIGIDDHDSPELGCTTHFSTNLIKILQKNNIKLLDFPYLIRLNPNIPWKTRGNGAVKIIVETEREKSEIIDIVWNESLDYTSTVSKALKRNRKPGVAITEKSKRNYLLSFYTKAISDVISLDTAKAIAEKFDIKIKGDRGIIGSLAAVGFKGAVTYELLTYRYRENWDKERKIDFDSLEKFDEKYFPHVFGNIDYIRKKPLIVSHSTDPVLYGIRGTNPEILLNGLKEIKVIDEDIENFMIFKTNQATDGHLIKTGDRTYQTISKTIIVDKVSIIKGGDVIIKSTENDTVIVYRETGELNKIAKELVEGDKITIIGAVKPSSKYGSIIETERIIIDNLRDLIEIHNPRCPICHGSTESLGKDKGLRCKKCGYRFRGSKISLNLQRTITLGIYQSRYYRHLTKPIFLNLEETDEILHIDILDKILKALK